MRFAALASGSEGNALVVEAGKTRLLLDCGLTLKETVSRLSALGLSPEGLAGVVVTHEHEDHAGGVARLARKYKLPVWLSWGTSRAVDFSGVEINIVDTHCNFSIGDIELEPYPVPHDAREPVQFVFGDGGRRLGVITDAGMPTAHIEEKLSGCDALVVECNHDAEMLKNSDYPKHLIRRISGRFGHLENGSSAALLARLDRRRLQHVVAAHLSRKNNLPVLARQALAGVLNCEEEWIGVADQDAGFGWREIL